ncbi:polyprenyl synthetase family protein [Bacteroidota bacterium]
MSNISLSDISRPIKEELNRFNDLFKSSLKSKVALVDLITKYILRQKGKKVRPLLVLMSAKLAGDISQRSYRGAILVELLHTATLVHDDVVDSAEKRRGLPSINAIWKNKIGVLMGDYLLARGLMKAVDGEDFDFLKVITNTVKRMSEGELLQIYKTKKLDIDEKTYFKIISDKTASLLSTCCEIGARSATTDEEQIQSLSEYGENLGIAFQIRDDILDYIGSASLFGKPLGGDIKEKKLTLPLIYSLEKCEKKEADTILKIIRKGANGDGIKKVMEFVQKYKGIDYSVEAAEKYADKAKENISLFPDSDAKTSLTQLIDFVVERKK